MTEQPAEDTPPIEIETEQAIPPVDEQLPPESDATPPAGDPPFDDSPPVEPTPITYPALVNLVREFNRAQASAQKPAIDLDNLPAVGETIVLDGVTYLVWIDGAQAAADVKPDDVVEEPVQAEVEMEPIHAANLALSRAQEVTRAARVAADEAERKFDGLLKAATSDQLDPTKHSESYIQESHQVALAAWQGREIAHLALQKAWEAQSQAEFVVLKLENDSLIAARAEHVFHYPEQ